MYYKKFSAHTIVITLSYAGIKEIFIEKHIFFILQVQSFAVASAILPILISFIEE